MKIGTTEIILFAIVIFLVLMLCTGTNKNAKKKKDKEKELEIERTMKCPDCDGIVSTSAETCPHCGRPFAQNKQQQKKNNGSWLGAFVTAILIILLIIFLLPEIGGFFEGCSYGYLVGRNW